MAANKKDKKNTPKPEIITPKASVGIAKMIGDIPDLEIFEGKNDLKHT